MPRKNVIRTVIVSPGTDTLIEKMAKVLDLHDICINGDKGVSVSSFIGAAFEVVTVSSNKESAFFELLQHFDLKDKNGDHISQERLKKLISEAFSALNN